jgi:hypothetical protein
VSELPFTPPKLFTQSFEPIIRSDNQSEETVPSNEYYDSPTEMGFSSFDSFEQPEIEIPRRRSYTKTSNGSNVSGEIIQVSRAVPSFPSPFPVPIYYENNNIRQHCPQKKQLGFRKLVFF